LLILIMTGLTDLFRPRAGLGRRFSPARHGASQRPRAEASLRALAVSVTSRRTGRPAEPGIRPAARDARIPAGMAVPCRNAARRRTRQRRQPAPARANAFETPPCAPGAGPLPPQRPALRPSADRTTHSNEKRLLSNSKSRGSPCRIFAAGLSTGRSSRALRLSGSVRVAARFASACSIVHRDFTLYERTLHRSITRPCAYPAQGGPMFYAVARRNSSRAKRRAGPARWRRAMRGRRASRSRRSRSPARRASSWIAFARCSWMVMVCSWQRLRFVACGHSRPSS